MESQKPLKVYWSRSLKNGKKNFGDWLSPILCEAISGRPVEYAAPPKCDLMAVGSILQKSKSFFPFGRKFHIWGSGLIEPQTLKLRHHVHSVRGKLTASHIINKNIEVFGDPGLLCDVFFSPPKIQKTHSIGLIPHYKDQKNPLFQDFIQKNPHAKIIDILSPKTFIPELTTCEAVLSSSLHGLIVADSFSIPNLWIQVSDMVRGNGFKFRDYYSIFGIEPEPFTFTEKTQTKDILAVTETYSRSNIDQIKREIINSFPFKT